MSQPNHPTSNRRRHFRISPDARAQRAETLEKERLERVAKEAAEESTDQMLKYYRANGITPSVPFSESASRDPERFYRGRERPICYLCVFWGNYSDIRKVSTRRGHLFYAGIAYRSPSSGSQLAPLMEISQHNLYRTKRNFRADSGGKRS